MTTNAELEETYYNGELGVEYSIGDRCYNCGNDCTDLEADASQGGIYGNWEILTNQQKLVLVGGWCCEKCSYEPCDLCGEPANIYHNSIAGAGGGIVCESCDPEEFFTT